MNLRLSKHHGLGNDFLVLLGDGDAVAPADAGLAIRLCARHRGVGADGLLVGRTDVEGADLAMTLFNADGSRAEMSGNGIRCLAQAEARRRGVDRCDLAIRTEGGLRTVSIWLDDPDDPDTVLASVDMGPALAGPTPDRTPTPADEDPDTARRLALEPRRAETYDLGNPHLVLLVDDPDAVDLAAAGRHHESAYSRGINVHVVAPSAGEADAMVMRVWERGAGITEACGTGAVAVARAAHDWGLTGDRVTVHMPGGDVVVEVGDPMVLTGPATYVADVVVTP